MGRNDREQAILDHIKERGFATVRELSATLYISPSSIRRDLTALEQKKLVRRVHGGAILIESANNNVPFSVRVAKNVEQKKKAAKAASVLLRDAISVMLDGSSTVMHLLKYIAAYRNIKVFTNNVHTFTESVNMGLDTTLIGGRASADASSLSGEFAEEMAEKIFPDILFFSAQCVNDDGEITEALEGEARLRRILLRHAKCRVFLYDREKKGKTSLYKVCNLMDVDYAFCGE